MNYFSIQFLDFFKELAANNHKIWFDENRKTYELFVKKPFSIFVQDFIFEIQKFNLDIVPDAKDAIFRINRDIRFSKDKTPYKLHMSALLSPQGRKDISNPGFYMEFNPEHLSLYGGIYMPNPAQIVKIRSHMAQNIDAFSKIIANPDFVQMFGTIQGDKQVRIPKELKEAAEKQPLIFNKQWYIQANLDPETILKPDLMSNVLNYYKVAQPLHIFINNALQ
jgi:uncharacterized protein (TIGR02453 family)